MHRLSVVVFALLLKSFSGFSQLVLPVNQTLTDRYSFHFYNDTSSRHTSILPFTFKNSMQKERLDSNLYYSDKRAILLLANYDFVSLKNKNVVFKLNPVYRANLTSDLASNTFYQKYKLGFFTRIDLFEKLELYYEADYHQADFLPDVQKRIDSTGMIPRFGKYNKAGNRYRYSHNSFYGLFKAGKYFTFHGGLGKHFWGEGYRSLLLSDNSRNYPFFKISLHIWKINYVVLYSVLKDIEYPYTDLKLKNKYTTSHLLSWNITRWLNLCLFETVIWRSDVTNNYRGFDVNYMNPVIFFRPVEFSLDNPSPDNVLLGAQLKTRIFDGLFLYNQLILDEFNLNELRKNQGWWGNKYGLQNGFKFFNPLGFENLLLQAEYNYVRPFTYAHISSLENYGNHYQPMAHPLGSNFTELIARAYCQVKRLSFSTRILFAQQGIDDKGTNMGYNIYRSYVDRPSDYDHELLQGDVKEMMLFEIKAGFLVNPSMNLSLEFGYKYRSIESSLSDYHYNLFWIGFVSTLYNEGVEY